MNPIMALLMQFLGSGHGGDMAGGGQDFMHSLMGTGAPDSWQKMFASMKPPEPPSPQFWKPPEASAATPLNPSATESFPDLSKLFEMSKSGAGGVWDKPATL